MSMLKKGSLLVLLLSLSFLTSCSLFGGKDANIHVVNKFAAEVTYIDYDAVVGKVPIAAGASVENCITVPADRTGLHRVFISVTGIGDLVSVSDVYTEPGGYTLVTLTPSLFMPL